MEIQKNFNERRKDKRFKLKHPAFAIMSYPSNGIAKITDISKSGLALRYSKNGAGFSTLNKLDIFKSDFSLYIDDIKAKTISDIEVIGKTFVGSKETRRCGIQFEGLSSEQISQLDNFIQSAALA